MYSAQKIAGFISGINRHMLTDPSNYPLHPTPKGPIKGEATDLNQ